MFKNNITVLLLMLMTLTTASCGPKKDYLVTIKTSYGDIKLILFDDTPLHKENFLKLAQAGRYDSTVFHRVIKEFMIQGGDVNAKEGSNPSPDNQVPAEILPHHIHEKGAVAAARNNNPQRKSSECQFYIVHGKTYTKDELTLDPMKVNQYFGKLLSMPQYEELRNQVIALQQAHDVAAMEAKMAEVRPLIEKEFDVSLEKDVSSLQLEKYTSVGGSPHLDGEYTVFGQVLEGLEVVDAIAAKETDGRDKPLEDIILTIEVEELKRKKIAKLFDYQYPEEVQ